LPGPEGAGSRWNNLVGRYRPIISDILAVVDIPLDCFPIPFAPNGESIAIGVNDIFVYV